MNRFIFRLVTRLLVISLLLGMIAPNLALHAQTGSTFVPDEVVVKLAQPSDLAGVAEDYRLDPTPISQFGTRPIYRLRILDGVSPPQKAAALAADNRVLYAEPNFLGETPEGQQRTSWAAGGSEEEFVAQWAAEKIRLDEAHTMTRGAGVIVAVLDTGVDLTHPQLAGRLLPGYDFVDMDEDPQEEGTHDANLAFGHGTHVAGLVALTAPEAQIMPVRVLDADGIGNIWVLAEALAYAVNPDGDLTTDDGADVINLSLSTTRQTNLLGEIVQEIVCRELDDDDDGGSGDDGGGGGGGGGDDDDGGGGGDDDDDDDDGGGGGGGDDDDDGGGGGGGGGDDDDGGGGGGGGDDDDDDGGGGGDDGDGGDDDARSYHRSKDGGGDGEGDDNGDDDEDANCLTFAGLGVVIVAAAGNNSSSTREYPASEEVTGVLAVGASTATDRLASFSNYGAWVEVAAPGKQIMSSVPGAGYGVWSGTSMAAPITAGVVALVRAAQPNLDASEVANGIVASAARIRGGVSRRVDAAAALGLGIIQTNDPLVMVDGQLAVYLPVVANQ
jgi:subtilisin family serine protease